MPKDAYWFKHDSNASHDPNIEYMMSEWGWEGYGWYWGIIETMRDLDGYRFPWKRLAVLTKRLGENAEKYIQQCIKEYDLFESDVEFFWSESLLRRMEYHAVKQTAGKAGANAKQKRSIEKEKEKEKEKEIYSAFFLRFWEEYPRKIGKKAAWAKWQATLKRGMHLEKKYEPKHLIKAAIEYAEVCKAKKTEETYVKHPATFLGPNEPWKDYCNADE